jgi:tetratricopeptide (TPR) repeat protein
MGAVWMADQTEPVKRRVAVKLIRTERSSSRTILSRFEAERQAIALMDHPNIAKLLDAGTTEEGVPFFVMELVKGVPLTEFCDQHRFSVPQRLRLFVQVCSAVQHAHQKGIIHRDLKPSNILVESYDGVPVPKVIDFGLAKAVSGLQLTEHTLFTGFGAVMGTPQYMAPEQASFNALDVDTRADVYALGAILYELLTGTTPLTRDAIKQAALDTLLKLIREQEPPTPSSRISLGESEPAVAANRQMEPAKLGRFVRGELDWIVLKALAKERGRRYDAASSFARDIERFLNHEPVQAGPPTTRYRIRKFIQRNRGAVLTAGLVLLALVTGTVGTTLGLVEARHQESRARAEADAKEQALLDEAEQRRLAQANEAIAKSEAAEKALALGRESAQRQLAQESEARAKTAAAAAQSAQKQEATERARAENAYARTADVLDAMTSAVTGDSLSTQMALSAEQKKFLTEVLKYYKEFAATKADDPRTRDRAARAAYRVGLIEYRLGRKGESAAAFRTARADFAALVAEFPADPPYRKWEAGTHNNLGNLVAALGKPADAEDHHRAALALYEKLADQFRDASGYRKDVAVTRANLALVLAARGKRGEAEDQLRTALAGLDRLAVEFPTVREYRQELAGCHNSLGTLLDTVGKHAEAEEQFRAALAVSEKLAVECPDVGAYQRDSATSRNNLGLLLTARKRSTEAQEQFRGALTVLEKLVAAFPAVPDYRQDLATCHHNLGVLLQASGTRAAMEHHRAALAVRKKLAAEFPEVPDYRKDLANTHISLGTLLTNSGKHAEAEERYLEALTVLEKLVAEYPLVPDYRQGTTDCLNNLGNVLVDLGKAAEALERYRGALALREKLAAESPTVPGYRQDVAVSHHNLGLLLLAQGKGAAAEEQLRKALAVREKLVVEFPTALAHRQGLAAGHNALAELLLARGKNVEAEEQLRKELSVREKLVMEFPAVIAYRKDLGSSYLNFGNRVRFGGGPDGGAEWYSKAITALEPVHESQPLDAGARELLRNSHWGRALAYGIQKKRANALRDWDRAVELSPKDEQPVVRAGRATARVNGGRVADAVAEVAELSKLAIWNATEWHNFACVYARASAQLADQKRAHADRALELLQKAVKAGYTDTARLKTDPDLDALRDRAEFKALVAELEKKP